MEFLRRLRDQVMVVWQGMSNVLRGLVIAALGLTVLGLGALVYYQSQTNYQPAFSNLQPEEIGAIAARLQAKNIPFTYGPGGTSILVPIDRVAAARVEAASGVGATGDTKGYGLFDDSPLGMTPFIQNVNLNRALQTELARSIGQLEPVAQARVHIVRPEPSPFVRDQKPTTASVVLRLKPRARLDRSTVDAIVALVSRGVEGLTSENVTVVDTAGRLLSESRTPEERGGGGQVEARRELETYLSGKAEDMLRRFLGVDRAIVRVAADLNAQRLREKSETYQPDGRAIVAERTTTQRTTGGSGRSGGVAGATSNVGSTATGATRGGAGGGTGATSQSEVNQADYLVSKTTREVENRPNAVDRITVAAMIDLSAPVDEGAKKLTLDDARDLIKQAIGFKEGRDEIKVTDVRLGTTPEPVPEPPAVTVSPTEYILASVRTASLIAGLLLLITLGILVTRRMLRARREEREARIRQAELEAAATAAALEALQPTEEIDEFRRLAEDDPDRLARVLKMLLETPA